MLPDDPGVPRATSDGMMNTGADLWVSRNTTTQCASEEQQQCQVPAVASGRLQFVNSGVLTLQTWLDIIYLRR